MLSLILTVAMTSVQPSTTQLAQFQPCVWPNRCATAPAPAVAQFQPCVWPNRCAVAPAPAVAQFQPCVWPNRCAVRS